MKIYDDCGLRRNEGVQLNVSDINFDNRLLHVRQGKGGQQRFAPFGKSTARHLISYTYDARPSMMIPTKASARNSKSTSEAFFINIQRTRTSGLGLSVRLKLLQERTDDPILQQQPLYLHVLRHSIATHLLYEGMTLEKVAQFLGHRSLESTQIYTHLMEKAYGSTETKVKEDG